MLACDVRERRFVRALLALGVRGKATAAAKIAGYGGPKSTHNALKVQAHHLTHRPRVQAAIHEEAVKELGAGKLIAVAGLLAIASNPDHPKHFDAIRDLMDRSGMAAKTEHKMTIERVQTETEKVTELLRLCDMLGWGIEKKRELLGNAMPLIEGEAGDGGEP